MLKIVLMLNQKSLPSCCFFLDHAKLLANIEKLKESKYSLFPLTGINPDIL